MPSGASCRSPWGSPSGGLASSDIVPAGAVARYPGFSGGSFHPPFPRWTPSSSLRHSGKSSRRPEVEFRVEQVLIDTFQREALGPSVSDGCRESCRRYASHVPSILQHPTHLSPFAMCRAFPGSDYYGDSVALGLAPRRRSRVPYAVDVQDGAGVPFVSLGVADAIQFPRSVLVVDPTQPADLPILSDLSGDSGCQPPYPDRRTLTVWTLGFNQSRLHHAVRASTGVQLDGFAAPCLFEHAAFPSGFRLQVGQMAQGYHAQLLPCCMGINDAVTRPASCQYAVSGRAGSTATTVFARPSSTSRRAFATHIGVAAATVRKPTVRDAVRGAYHRISRKKRLAPCYIA